MNGHYVTGDSYDEWMSVLPRLSKLNACLLECLVLCSFSNAARVVLLAELWRGHGVGHLLTIQIILPRHPHPQAMSHGQ